MPNGGVNKSIFDIIIALLIILQIMGVVNAIIITVGPIDCDYTSIQEAIDAANPGDTIEVKNDTYYENVNVTKRIILKGIGMPLLDAGGIGSGITLLAEGTRLEGFRVENSSFKWPAAGGIKVISDKNVIQGNNLDNIWDNILLYRSNDNIVVDNIIEKGQSGIALIGSGNNTIKGNYITNSEDGIILDNSENNIIEGNFVQNNSDDGILFINNSMDNIMSANNVNHNGWHGLELFLSNDNSITENNASYNGVANLLILGSDGNMIVDNVANFGGYFGICLVKSSNNTLSDNDVSYNEMIGMSLESSNNNLVFGNNFAFNARYDTQDDGMNNWDNGEIGNHFGTFDEAREGCNDDDNDGICDSAYHIPMKESVDRYPIAL
jgi:parallel beta-helix repeat protein